jgi:putative MATE family efflux protein
MAAKNQMDLTRGPLFLQTVIYTLPLALSGLLQLGFHTADMIVIGRFASADSLAAVGSTGSLCIFLIMLFCGLSVGANVVVANFFGARDHRNLSRAAHTSVLLSMVGGLAVMFISLAASRPLLILMGVPREILGKACLYMWIYSVGIPPLFLYNFGSAILRAVGDTRRPLFYLTTAGVANVLLNLLLVIVFHLDVVGVAVATVASHVVSATLILRNLSSPRSACRIRRKLLRIDARILRNVVRIGLPAGVQSVLYSVANMTIQSGVNTFGPNGMAGNAASASLEGVIHIFTSAYYQSVTTFVSQNYGAGKFNRIVASFWYCLWSPVAMNLLFAGVITLLAPTLVSIYNPDPEVVDFGASRLKFIALTYVFCTLMDVITGTLRGLGHSVRPAIVTLVGACLLRILWVLFVFPHHKTLPFLVLCFPLSWVAVSILNGEYLVRLLRNMRATIGAPPPNTHRKENHDEVPDRPAARLRQGA